MGSTTTNKVHRRDVMIGAGAAVAATALPNIATGATEHVASLSERLEAFIAEERSLLKDFERASEEARELAPPVPEILKTNIDYMTRPGWRTDNVWTRSELVELLNKEKCILRKGEMIREPDTAVIEGAKLRIAAHDEHWAKIEAVDEACGVNELDRRLDDVSDRLTAVMQSISELGPTNLEVVALKARVAAYWLEELKDGVGSGWDHSWSMHVCNSIRSLAGLEQAAPFSHNEPDDEAA